MEHIFQNAKVTSNKMVHKKWHHFPAQFSLPFHTVPFCCKCWLKKPPSDWLKLFDIRCFYIQWFWKLTLTKRITSREREWKTVPENGVFYCVPFCLRSLRHFERCGKVWFLLPTHVHIRAMLRGLADSHVTISDHCLSRSCTIMLRYIAQLLTL